MLLPPLRQHTHTHNLATPNTHHKGSYILSDNDPPALFRSRRPQHSLLSCMCARFCFTKRSFVCSYCERNVTVPQENVTKHISFFFFFFCKTAKPEDFTQHICEHQSKYQDRAIHCKKTPQNCHDSFPQQVFHCTC